MDINIQELFPNTKIGEIKEDEYAGENGLPYCKNCKTPRFFKIKTEKEDVLMRGRCKCQEEELKKEQAEEARQKHIEEFRYNQKLSMLGDKYLNAGFKNAVITEHNKEAYKKCKNYVQNATEVLKQNIGIYLYGDNSSGKTFLTACMCNSLVEQGFKCIYTSVPTMIAEIQKSYTKDVAMGQAELVSMLSTKAFVFIDDLGKEFLGREGNPSQAKFAEKLLLEVLNARYNNNRPTIFSSNYSIQELADVFSLDKAIIERINEMSTRVIKLEGDDFRAKALQEKSDIAKKLGI